MPLMKFLIPTLLLLISANHTLGAIIYDNVAEFSIKNGFFQTKLVILGNQGGTMGKKLLKALQTRNVRTTVCKMEDIRVKELEWLEEKIIFLLDDNAEQKGENSFHEEVRQALAIIKKTKVKGSLFILPSHYNLAIEGQYKNTFFFTLHHDSEKWNQVIQLNHVEEMAMNELPFPPINKCRWCTKDVHDLKNMTIISNDLTWPPLLVLKDCEPDGKGCTASGLLWDLIKTMKKTLNVKVEVREEQSNLWGLSPIEGAYNRSGTFVGVLGAVINGDSHISLTEWLMTVKRIPLVDIVKLHSDPMLLAMTPKHQDFDLGLYIRPFTSSTWTATFITLPFCGLTLSLTYSFRGITGQTPYRLAVFSTWLFYVGVNVFFEGALTMFFSTAPDIPFQSMRDVLDAHPEWSITTTKDLLEFIKYRAESGDEDMALLNEYVANNFDELVFNNSDEAFENLSKGKFVVYTLTSQLKHYLKQNPHKIDEVYPIVRGGDVTPIGVALNDNSPLLPAIEYALLEQRENGNFPYITAMWEGKKVSSENYKKEVDASTMVLNAGQVILSYILMGIGTAAAFLIFIMELILKFFKERANKITPTLTLIQLNKIK